MDRNTFTDDDVINLIKDKFIPVKFDAVYKEEVEFNNNNFKLVKAGRRRINELALHLTNGN